MADGTTVLTGAELMAPARLSDTAGAFRHLVARCAAPQCDRASACDPAPWFAQKLDGARLSTLSERLRCVCGSRSARLEMRPGALVRPAHPDLYIFR